MLIAFVELGGILYPSQNAIMGIQLADTRGGGVHQPTKFGTLPFVEGINLYDYVPNDDKVIRC